MNFFSFLFFFYRYTMLSSRTVDGHQMYSGGLVVGEVSLIDPDILPTLPLICTRGQCEIWHHF